MLQFLANNGGTILVSVVLAVIVVAVARYMIRQKSRGTPPAAADVSTAPAIATPNIDTVTY